MNPEDWILRADDRVRTGDLNLGKVPRYQLRYVRKAPAIYRRSPPCPKPSGFGLSFGGKCVPFIHVLNFWVWLPNLSWRGALLG